MGKLANQLMKVGVPLAKKFLTPLAIKASASEIYSVIQGKLRKQEVVRTGVSETVARVGRGYNKMDEMIKKCWLHSIL